MPQPNFSELLGAGSQWNAADGQLEIPLTALQAAGLTGNSPSALEVYGALVKNAHTWLSNNEDQAVMAASDLTVSSPFPRNGENKVQFQFSERFYAPYSTPEFNPNEV